MIHAAIYLAYMSGGISGFAFARGRFNLGISVSIIGAIACAILYSHDSILFLN